MFLTYLLTSIWAYLSITIARESTAVYIPTGLRNQARPQSIGSDSLCTIKWRGAMRRQMKHMTDSCCTTEGGRAFSGELAFGFDHVQPLCLLIA